MSITSNVIKLGMYSKSGGDSRINGYDTENNMDIVRQSLGICPQHNMLFPELTVGEHFTMFGMVSTPWTLPWIHYTRPLKANNRKEKYSLYS